MLLNRADSHMSGTRFVGRLCARHADWKPKPHHKTQTSTANWQDYCTNFTLSQEPKPTRQTSTKKTWPRNRTEIYQTLCRRNPAIFEYPIWPNKVLFQRNPDNRGNPEKTNHETQPRKRTCAKMTWPKDSPNNSKRQLAKTSTNAKTEIEKTTLNLETR